MDVKIINPFVEALVEVATSMAQLELTVGKPFLKQATEAEGEVSGFIELKSAQHNGSLAITFDRPALLLVYERMLGEALETVDDSALDLAGEITNMVCGGAKQRLASNGYDFELTTPSMLKGDHHVISHLGGGPVIGLPLSTQNGQVMLEVSLNR